MNRYKVIRTLGDGTYGEVIAATNRQVQMRVSLGLCVPLALAPGW